MYSLLQELKEPSVIYQSNPEDPNDPEVFVKGVGRYKLSSLVKNVQDKLVDLGERSAQASDHNDWKRVEWMLNHDAMREMIRTIVQAKKELGGIKGIGENALHMTYEGYVLNQEEQYEEDNVKIFHSVVTPSGKRHILEHTPYEFLEVEDFAQYVNYHKNHGEWPKHPTHTNWDKDSLHTLLEGRKMFDVLRGRKNSKEDELKDQLVRLNQFIKQREEELNMANKEVEDLKSQLERVLGTDNSMRKTFKQKHGF